MCGITGIYNPDGLEKSFRDKELFKKMILSMQHRGPDEQGALYSTTGYLGAARLSIIDIETGSQPIYSKKYNIAVVCNGEIYNYEELRAELKQKNYHFETAGDIEPLIYLYREYGSKMLAKLNGQFALAIIDFESNKIFMARDRFGIRPLFYTLSRENLLFASSVKSLTMRPEIESEFSYKAYNQLISLWTTYGDTTFIKNISSVRAGEFIEYSKKGLSKKFYWDLSFDDEPHDHSIREWKEKIYETLDRATRIRLKADVPVNVYLSGGLDSSIIMQLMKENQCSDLESFSVRFHDKQFDETEYQRIMSDHTGIRNNAITMSYQDIGSVFEHVIWHSEQPVFRTAPAPLHHLSKLVNSKGFKVVLTGEGADETAWGYNIFKETLIRYHLAKNPENDGWT
ncbi:asparagine synthase (glutamine-hydrolyzing), partial [candidate division CSSED10-310 bacterium]